jgi:pantetheine-phosphate adenylyltransferase
MNNTIDIEIYHNKNFFESVKELVKIEFEAYSPLNYIIQNKDFATLGNDDLMVYEYQKNFELQREREILLFKEFQFIEFSIYRSLRINQIKEANKKIDTLEVNSLLTWFSCYQPKIAVYAGSFNPFHKGHYNILQKAEKIFDKVIVARGENPEKTVDKYPMPSKLKFRQLDNYNTLLTDYLNIFNYPITLIRGLRNSTDFQYEMNQYRYLNDLKPDIRMVSIFCDKEFEHISSTGIRNLEKYGRGEEYLIN